MPLYLQYILLISCSILYIRTHCSLSHNSAELTTARQSSNNASVTILNTDDVSIINNRWNLGVTTQIGFHMLINLEPKSWGFHPTLNSTITVTINSTTTPTIPDKDLILSFSVGNSQYLTIFLIVDNTGSGNGIWPNALDPPHGLCGQPLATGSVNTFVNDDRAFSKTDRQSKASGGTGTNPFPLDNFDDGILNQWPITISIENRPSINSVLVSLQPNSNDTSYIQKCLFTTSFMPEQGMQIYIGGDDLTDDLISLSSFKLEYNINNLIVSTTTDQPQETVSDPTTYITSDPTANPTSGPTYHPSMSPTTTSSPTTTIHPTIYPTLYPTISPLYPPSNHPSLHPTVYPITSPTSSPTDYPTNNPVAAPTTVPSRDPTPNPTYNPSTIPSKSPITLNQSTLPTVQPFVSSSNPSKYPSNNPTKYPTYGGSIELQATIISKRDPINIQIPLTSDISTTNNLSRDDETDDRQSEIIADNWFLFGIMAAGIIILIFGLCCLYKISKSKIKDHPSRFEFDDKTDVQLPKLFAVQSKSCDKKGNVYTVSVKQKESYKENQVYLEQKHSDRNNSDPTITDITVNMESFHSPGNLNDNDVHDLDIGTMTFENEKDENGAEHNLSGRHVKRITNLQAEGIDEFRIRNVTM